MLWGVRILILLRLNNVPCVCISHFVYPFLCQQTLGHFNNFVVIWWTTQLWTWVCKYLFLSLLSVLWGTYPEVECDTRWCFYFWFFEGLPCCLPVAAPSHIPTSKARGFRVLAPSPTLVFVFLIAATRMGMKWYLLDDLFYISLMTRDAGHLFMCYWPFAHLWENVYPSPLTIF